MSWATRATSIVAFLWGLFILLLMASSGQSPTPQFMLVWLIIFIIPCMIIWTILSLIMGDRGKIDRRY